MISSSVASTLWNSFTSFCLSVGSSPQRRHWLVMAKISWMTFFSLLLSMVFYKLTYIGARTFAKINQPSSDLLSSDSMMKTSSAVS